MDFTHLTIRVSNFELQVSSEPPLFKASVFSRLILTWWILAKEFKRANWVSLQPLCNAMGVAANPAILTVVNRGWVIESLDLAQSAQIITATCLTRDKLNVYVIQVHPRKATKLLGGQNNEKIKRYNNSLSICDGKMATTIDSSFKFPWFTHKMKMQQHFVNFRYIGHLKLLTKEKMFQHRLDSL